jgi:hypothetical protein
MKDHFVKPVMDKVSMSTLDGLTREAISSGFDPSVIGKPCLALLKDKTG